MANWFNSLTSWFSPAPVQIGANMPVTPSFFNYQGKSILFNLDNEDDYRKAYIQCPALKSIINKRAQMFVNGNVQILNKNTGNEKRGATAKLLKDRLKKPNPLQSWKQFFAQFHTYIDLFGYCPILKIEPAGMPGTISALWCLPPWMFDVDYTGKWMNQTEQSGIYKQFYIKWANEKKPLDMKNTCLVLDNSIGTDWDSSFLIPDSRVKSNELYVSNLVASLKSFNTLTTKKGAIGILSNHGKDAMGAIPMQEGEKISVQEDFKRYGLNGEEWQVIITDASLQWQSMSFPTRDLMLFEGMENAVTGLADGMGLYPYLLGLSSKNTTFNNLSEAKKSQYQDHIIPDAEARIEQLSAFLIPESENAYLWIDYSHIDILQQSLTEKAQGEKAKAEALAAQWDLGLLTRNMMLEELDRDIITGRPEDFETYKFENKAIEPIIPIDPLKTEADEPQD